MLWQPNKRQELFLSVPDSVFEILGGGAAGGGKTDLLLVLPIAKKTVQSQVQLYEHPKFKMLYMRRTFPELEKEVIPRSWDFYEQTGAKYNGTEHVWKWPSGARLEFGHCEHDKDVRKYDTAQYNIIAFDEVTSFTPYQYEYLAFQRCRSGSADLPAIVRAATNPGNVSHSYFKKRFVDPCKTGDVLLSEVRKLYGKDTVLKRMYVPFKATDNIALMKSDPGYLDRLNRITDPAERAAKLEGSWDIFSGQVFEDFREFPLNPIDPSEKIHVIEPFQIPEYWPKILSIDWGFSALTVAGWYAINPCPSPRFPAKIYKYREYSRRAAKISEWASDIARLSTEQLMDTVLDPSAWGHRGDEKTIAEQFTEHSGIIPSKADNERASGKLLMQDMIRTKQKPAKIVPETGYDHELALKIRRLRGDKGLAEYQALFEPEPVELLPQFQIFNTCTGTIENLPLCIYDKDNREDVAELKNDTDDYYDETRYGLKRCQRFLQTGIAEHDRAAEVARICENLEHHKSSPSAMTKFYIDMGRLESQSIGIGKVRLHGRSKLKGANW
jgi:hypothetical protein